MYFAFAFTSLLARLEPTRAEAIMGFNPESRLPSLCLPNRGVADNDKHSSLLRYGINYVRKNFVIQNADVNFINI